MGEHKLICELKYQEAVDAIAGTVQVFYKHGIWNEYQLRPTNQVVQSIKSSSYGADVFRDDKGAYYVSIPCDSDMW